MIKAKALIKYTPNWADQVKGVSKENGYSWPYEIQPKVMVVNPNVYTAATAPKDFPDLWEKQEFHGKYAVPTEFSGNTNRAIIGGILARYLDKSGELGVSKKGWTAIKEYFANGYKTPKGEDDFANMASGKVPITFTYVSALQAKCTTYKINPIIVYPTIGEPTNTNQIGVVANKDKAVVNESIRFANWLGSTDVIGAYAAANGNMLTNKAAASYLAPIIKKVQENYKAQKVDWSYVNSMMDQWVAKIQLDIMS